MKQNATVPAVGQTYRADFGAFAAELTFDSATQLTFELVDGDGKGATDTMPITTTVDGEVVTSILLDGNPIVMTGTWTKVRRRALAPG